jgi:hypothetical protein
MSILLLQKPTRWLSMRGGVAGELAFTINSCIPSYIKLKYRTFKCNSSVPWSMEVCLVKQESVSGGAGRCVWWIREVFMVEPGGVSG